MNNCNLHIDRYFFPLNFPFRAVSIMPPSSDSDSDSLDMRLERRVLRYKSEDVLAMSDRDFQKNFRLNKAAFKYVLTELEFALSGRGRQGALSAKDKLCACLRFFAEGSYQHSVGKDFNVNIAQSTFCKVLDEFLTKMENLLCSKWISMSMNVDEERTAKMTFYEKCRIPNVVMAVDGTHVKIVAPNCNKHLFFNRKGYYSINVMLICDHEQKIRYVSSKYPGSCHDSHIWEMNAAKIFLQSKHSNRRNCLVLGDKGYPLQPWLLTPYREPVNSPNKIRFNTAHSKGRIIVERTIGVLKSVFRCINNERGLHYDPEKSAKIINICCALHNIRLHYNVTEEEFDLPLPEEEDTTNTLVEDDLSEEANEIRNEIMQNF